MKICRKICAALLAASFIVSGWTTSHNISEAAKNYHDVAVQADYETDAVVAGNDAADDPAIWVHPKNPSKSTIIATNKQGGLLVYDLKGKELYNIKVGKPNNVDVRYSFPLGKEKIDIAAATDRSQKNGLIIYKINHETGELTNIAARDIFAKMKVVYGFSLYHSLKTDKYYALISGYEGEFEQYELFDNGKGKIDAKLVRSLEVGSISEGLVADDEYGCFYISEENIGIWKYGAEPDAGTKRVQVDSVGAGHLIADVEGLTIYYARNGKGHLIASSQGNNSYNVYERSGMNSYIGSFSIDDGKIDGTNDTDGIDVVGFNLGKEFPNGLFIAQDGENIDGAKKLNQNFKIVRWEKIFRALSGIELDNTVNPRKLKRQ
jgi:3-phytase